MALRLRRTTSAVLAVLWGYLFVQIFRYTLNSVYPFIANWTSLSLFSTLLASVTWLSFHHYYLRHHVQQRQRRFFVLVSSVNLGMFLILVWQMGEQRYLHWFPVLFLLQLIVQMYLFASKLPFFLVHRIFLAGGVFAGFLPFLSIADDIRILFPAAAFLTFFPNRLLRHGPIHLHSRFRMRLIPLRSALDFIRFLMLGYATYGLFDSNRSRFFPFLAALALILFVQWLLLTAEKSKRHMREGLLVLSVVFMIIAGGFFRLPVIYACLTGYALLSFWESLYFRKAIEGYSSRERLLAALTFLLVSLLYLLTDEWSLLVVLALLILMQIRILIYVSGMGRRMIIAFQIISIVIWTALWGHSWFTSLTSRLLAERPAVAEPVVDVRELAYIMQKSPGPLHTNILKDSPAGQIPGMAQIVPIQTAPAALTIQMLVAGTQDWYIELPGPYRTNEGSRYLREFADSFSDVRLQIAGNVTGQPDPEMTGKLAILLAEKYRKESRFADAMRVLDEIRTGTETDAAYLSLRAAICGATGDVTCQISALERLPESSRTTDDYRLMMELYYLSNRYGDSSRIAEILLRSDSGNALTYLGWMHRIASEKKEKYQLRSLYARVAGLSVPPAKQAEKADLLRAIEGSISENPEYFELYRKELERQERVRRFAN